MTDSTYAARRDRVAIQVCSRRSGDDWTDEHMLQAVAAADMTFTARINDLDWESATLARLNSQ